MTTDSYIFLEDLHFFACHGVAEQEQQVGNEYRIDVRLRVDISRAAQTDDVADTVNYAEVYELVRREMSLPSRLLEHVAGRIATSLFARFPQVAAISLMLRKRNPPMGADIAWAGVEVHTQREDSKEKNFLLRT